MDRRPHRGEARREQVARRLIDWYRAARRDLPWRHTSDAYRIWLSETMLQQTRVETVIPYYERFLARFPNVESLAAADEDDVLGLWAGLGYYARARNLRRAARQVVAEHAGELPSDAESLAALPGVGRYTVGALRSIAFGESAALVDGNVRRVLARLYARRELDDAGAWQLAEELLPEQDAGDWNQGLMELGATLCSPKSPRCLLCPLTSHCGARAHGQPEQFPAPKPRAEARRVRAVAGVLVRRSRVLMLRRPSRGLLGGLWELPSAEGRDPRALVTALAERAGLAVEVGDTLGGVRHLFTHRDLSLELYALYDRGGRIPAAARPEARFCGAEALAALPLSRLMNKALALARPIGK
jgi:A/G-specific adenine glycosylase